MSTNINRLADYTVCPWKLQQDSSKDEFETFEDLKVAILSRLTKYYYGALGRNGKVHPRDLRTRLGFLWREFKPKAKFMITEEHLLSLNSRALGLHSLGTPTIIGTNFPMFLNYKDIEITGDLDVLCKVRSDILEGIWFDTTSYPTMGPKDTPVVLKSLFFHNSLKRRAYKYASSFRIRVLRISDGHNFLVPVESRQLSKLIKPLYSSIEAGHLYPRASKLTCRPCEFRKECQWSTTA